MPPRYQGVLDGLAAKQREIEAFHEQHHKSEVSGLSLLQKLSRGSGAAAVYWSAGQRATKPAVCWNTAGRHTAGLVCVPYGCPSNRPRCRSCAGQGGGAQQDA